MLRLADNLFAYVAFLSELKRQEEGMGGREVKGCKKCRSKESYDFIQDSISIAKLLYDLGLLT